MPIQQRFFGMRGGLDLETPSVTVDPGRLIGAQNYEARVQGGYRRIDGYERFDGRPRPSDASYWIITFDAGSTAIAAGDLIGDSASPTIQGEALIDAVVESGSWGGADAAGYVPVMGVAGKSSPGGFSDDDALYVGASQVATAAADASERGASTDALDSTYYQDAIETTRADIGAVTGSGDILGVAVDDAGDVYAWRNNAGGTAAVMWKASTSGWTAVDLGATLAFTSGGTTEIAVGDTITGATSGASAVVTRVELDSGSWAGGDAAGTFHLRAVTSGPFQSENLDVGASTNLATIAGAQSDVTLSPSGRLETIVANFSGAGGTRNLYGCDGVNKAFEWDGTAYIQITTGMDSDTPSHIAAHMGHLFLLFPAGSVQHSSIGAPHTWSPVTGAAELALGDEGTGFLTAPQALVCLTRETVKILYGTSAADWNLTTFSDESGAIEWSAQRLGAMVYADDRGMTALSAAQEYGNFLDAVFSAQIQRLYQTKKASIVASMRVREKQQYRLFFSDKTAFYVTLTRGQAAAIMPVELGDQVTCTASAEDATGAERLFFGADDGYVYELDRGTSCDGDEVTAFLRPWPHHCGSPAQRKRFRRLELHMDAPGPQTLTYQPSFSYEGNEFAQAAQQSLDVSGGGGYWNVDSWNDFYWSAPDVPVVGADANGTGVALGGVILSQSTYDEPHTIAGATITYSPRRRQR